MRHILIIVSIFLFSFTIISCAKKSSTDDTTTTTDTTAPDFISEITQTVGSDGLLTGSFVVPEDGISFLLSIFLGSNSSIKFYSLTDPDGTDILSASSTPNLYNEASGRLGSSGYSNVPT